MGLHAKEVVKTAYFIRHGESTYAAENIFNVPEAPLSKAGVRQAEALAKRFTNLPVDFILASSYARARETANIINQMLHKPIEYTDLLREVKHPTEIEGKRMEDPEAIRIWELIHARRLEPDWRYSDEENFSDRKRRAHDILTAINALPYEHILLATHSGVTKTVVAYLLFGEEMTPVEYDKFLRFTNMKNTGITVCKQLADGRWKLLTWNDLAHLG